MDGDEFDELKELNNESSNSERIENTQSIRNSKIILLTKDELYSPQKNDLSSSEEFTQVVNGTSKSKPTQTNNDKEKPLNISQQVEVDKEKEKNNGNSKRNSSDLATSNNETAVSSSQALFSITLNQPNAPNAPTKWNNSNNSLRKIKLPDDSISTLSLDPSKTVKEITQYIGNTDYYIDSTS